MNNSEETKKELVEEINFMSELRHIMYVFDKSFITDSNELILVPKCNAYISLHNVKTIMDLRVKIMKCIPYHILNQDKQKDKKRILNNFNIALNAKFTEEDIQLIYNTLAKDFDNVFTEKFIFRDYDLRLLQHYYNKANFKNLPLSKVTTPLYEITFEYDHYIKQSVGISYDTEGKIKATFLDTKDSHDEFVSYCFGIIDKSGYDYNTVIDYGEEDLDFAENLIAIIHGIKNSYPQMKVTDFIEEFEKMISNRNKNGGQSQ